MNTSLPDRLKLIRNSMPQAEFAALVGIHKSSWGRFERGDSEPSSSDLKSICSILNISAEWLLLGTGPMTPNLPSENDQEKIPLQSTAQYKKIEEELENERRERRELVNENRQLHRDKEALLRENGELREKVARLEERKRRYELTHGFPAESSKVGS